MAERVQKVLARLGYGSRREIESWMRAGRVGVNRIPVQPGASVAQGDAISIDGRHVFTYGADETVCRVLMYHKPEGEVCTRADPEGRPTIFDRLPRIKNARWVGVGRLDFNTAGLILLVTSGELANRLMHPATGIEREYLVRVLGEVGPDVLARLREGVLLEDGKAAFDQIHEVGGGEGVNRWFRVVLREGRNREVRRLWESQGVKVSRLKRTRFGPVSLPRHVRRGHYEELDDKSVAELLRMVGMAAERPRSVAEPALERRNVRKAPGGVVGRKPRPGPGTKKKVRRKA